MLWFLILKVSEVLPLFNLINEASSKDIKNWFTTKYLTSQGIKLDRLVKRRKMGADFILANLEIIIVFYYNVYICPIIKDLQ